MTLINELIFIISMPKRKKIEELRAELESEYNSEVVNMKIVNRLREQIITLGLGLTGRDLTKPF